MADEKRSERGQRSWFYPAKLLARAQTTEKHIAVGWISRDEARHVMEMPDNGVTICLMRSTSVFESHMQNAEGAIIDG